MEQHFGLRASSAEGHCVLGADAALCCTEWGSDRRGNGHVWTEPPAGGPCSVERTHAEDIKAITLAQGAYPQSPYELSGWCCPCQC